jgi:hypothetical protein
MERDDRSLGATSEERLPIPVMGRETFGVTHQGKKELAQQWRRLTQLQDGTAVLVLDDPTIPVPAEEQPAAEGTTTQ